MYDLLTTAAIVDELDGQIAGGRVQSTGLIDGRTMVLEVYANRRRRSLVTAIGGREPVCYLSRNETRPDPTIVTPFTLLLRKHVRGGTIVAIDQPPLEKILRLTISKVLGDGSDADEGESGAPDSSAAHLAAAFTYVSLNIELMGRRSNVILVDDGGTILDAIKRVTPSMSRVRPVGPHGRYVLPPTGDRLDPRTVTARQIASILADGKPGDSVTTVLTRHVSGMSPQMAAEALFAAAGSPDPSHAELEADAAEAIARSIRSVVAALGESAWTPMEYVDRDNRLEAYAACPQKHLEHRFIGRPVDAMSVAVEHAAGSDQIRSRHAGRRDRLVAAITQDQERARTKVVALREQQREAQDGDRFRRWGEGILANLWALTPDQKTVLWEGEEIPLSSEIAPADLAQDYFRRYRKAGRGQEQLGALIAEAQTDLDYLDQLAILARMAESFDDIEALNREWSARAPDGQDPERKGRKLRAKPAERAPKPVTDQFGNAVLIGKSGRSNDIVTFTIASPDDYWLHARGVPGAHVILRPARQNDPNLEAALEQAAQAAGWFSAARTDSFVEVDICKRRDVRKIKGAGPGMVTYRNERTIRVTPLPPA